MTQARSMLGMGLTEFFECSDCSDMRWQLETCLVGGHPTTFCDDPENTEEFDLDTFLDNCAVMLYLGVRFE